MQKQPAPRTRPRLVYMTTHPTSALHLLRGQLAHMRQRGFDVIVVSSSSAELEAVAQREGVTTIAIPMEREISPWRDLIALGRVYRALREVKPDIVNAGTPKAGLLGMAAAFLARVPYRVYTLRGLRLQTTSGWKSFVLSLAERIAARCAHHVLCVSRSIQHAYVSRGLAPAEKTFVLGSGSSNGVDAARFQPSDTQREEAARLRAKLGVPIEAPVIGYIGRLTSDKGIVELFQSFERLLPEFPELRLVLIGDWESGDSIPDDCVRRLKHHPQVVLTGPVPETAPYYGLLDLVVFPSHREGFPNVPLEAAAAGLPVVGFEATGTVDAVQHGRTGTLVPLGDVQGLAEAVARYLEDPDLRRQHGEAGRTRAAIEFRREAIWEALYQHYESALRRVGFQPAWNEQVSVAGRLEAYPTSPLSSSSNGPEAAAPGSFNPEPTATVLPMHAPVAAGAVLNERPINGSPAPAFYRTTGKRLLDLLITIPALILVSPILAMTAILIRLDSRGPALFVQERLGQHGRVFRAYKFRTMTHKLRTTHREIFGKTDEVTRLGYWLRRFKLDELPQLLNIVKGDLSLVGPRPALPAQIAEYNEEGHRRLLVRPGLSGLAQVHGGVYLSWPQRWTYDAEYVDRLSFALDLWILLRTTAVVLLGEEKFLRIPNTTQTSLKRERRIGRKGGFLRSRFRVVFGVLKPPAKPQQVPAPSEGRMDFQSVRDQTDSLEVHPMPPRPDERKAA